MHDVGSSDFGNIIYIAQKTLYIFGLILGLGLTVPVPVLGIKVKINI